MPRTKRRGKSVKKNKARGDSVPDELTRAPHSFVIHRGKTGQFVEDLSLDFRKVMEPFTASKLKVRPKNSVKDFVNLAGVMNVTHLTMFTRTERGPYVRFARFPRGPTLTFKVDDYVLARDVRSSLRRQVTYGHQFANHPLLILNGFGGGGGDDPQQQNGVQLMTSMFQNMFPSINVTTVKLSSVRRCVLLNRDPETGDVEFRHYTIKVVPTGVSRPLKKLVQGKVPNLSRYGSIAEYVAKGGGGNISESEAEEDEASQVSLPQSLGSRGNRVASAAAKSSVKLVELGPRMRMRLVKIEEGLLDGEVLHHALVTKTSEEKAEIRRAREKKKREKARRKSEQEGNVKRKEREREGRKAKSLAGMRAKEPSFRGQMAEQEEEDTDEEWYRKEVGTAPDKDLFGHGGGGKRKASSEFDSSVRKRMKKAAAAATTNRREKGSAAAKGSKSKRKVFNSQGIGPNYSKRKGKAPPASSSGGSRRGRRKKGR